MKINISTSLYEFLRSNLVPKRLSISFLQPVIKVHKLPDAKGALRSSEKLLQESYES